MQMADSSGSPGPIPTAGMDAVMFQIVSQPLSPFLCILADACRFPNSSSKRNPHRQCQKALCAFFILFLCVARQCLCFLPSEDPPGVACRFAIIFPSKMEPQREPTRLVVLFCCAVRYRLVRPLADIRQMHTMLFISLSSQGKQKTRNSKRSTWCYRYKKKENDCLTHRLLFQLASQSHFRPLFPPQKNHELLQPSFNNHLTLPPEI